VPVDPGTYTAGETLLSGYTFEGFSGDCDAAGDTTVTLGESKSCTLTNDDIQPQLLVIKHVINDNGGPAVAGDFTMSVSGTNATPGFFAGEESPGTEVALDVGIYNVGESGPSGYAATYSADCTGAITIGEVKTCTVTNDDIPPQLVVIKHVINDNGGTAEAADFTMSVSGSNADPASSPGAESPGTEVALDAGAYIVSESGPSGYAASYSADCTGAMAVGEVKTCTVTNNDEKASPGIATEQKWILHDSALLSGIRPGAADAGSATVLFRLFSDAQCTTEVFSEMVDINSGIAQTSLGYVTTVPGTYYWTAFYSGDNFNEPQLSGCGTESTTITAVQ
jgi:hypothetical protein